MSTISARVQVPGIHCNHCKSSIEGSLEPLEGVARAVVDVPERTVHVDYDPQAVDRALIVSTIEEQGYEVIDFKEVG
jgi:copper chaperone